MAVDRARLRPGCVIVVSSKSRVGWWIRLRSRLMGLPDLHNHVALATHRDETGRWRGLEGRPSGFGWANLERLLDHPDTIANVDQPIDDEDRDAIVRAAIGMVGLPYDWAAILAFASGVAGVPFLAQEWPDDGVPSHVVCSSAVDVLYEGRGLANPGGRKVTRGTDPAAWTAFVVGKLWLLGAGRPGERS